MFPPYHPTSMGSTNMEEKSVNCDIDKNDLVCSLDSDKSLNQCNNSPISPHDLRVIVDTMLQGLGWNLRSVGVDTFIMRNNQDHKDAIALALQGNRIVLTAGKVYQMFASRLGESKCFSVSSQNVKEQLKEVLTHFNVKIKEEDLLSRCQICNCKTFVLVESEKMHVLKEVKPSSSSTKKKSWISDPNGAEAVESIPDPDMLFSSMVTHPVYKLESYPILENEELIDMDTALYRTNGVAIQLEHIPNTLFAEDKIFYCCISCGKVYWDGCHYKRVLEQINELIPFSVDDET